MATKPTAADVRSLLEGYCIDSNILSDTWINNIRDDFVINYLEKKLGFSMTGEAQVTEYYNGTGKSILFLNKKNIVSLDRIQYVVNADDSFELSLTAYELIATEGMIKAIKAENYLTSSRSGFPKGVKNIKVTYTHGYDADSLPNDLAKGLLYLTTEKVLAFIEGRGGGGNITAQGFSKNYGNSGKYTNIRNMLARMGYGLIHDYATMTTGS